MAPVVRVAKFQARRIHYYTGIWNKKVEKRLDTTDLETAKANFYYKQEQTVRKLLTIK